MSYVVYARKYRPKKFADVVGQQHICRTLLNAIRQDRLPHALVFNGPRGVGKTSTARILAKSLNCLEQHEGEPCGVCRHCEAIDSGAFLDVVEMDAASSRGIDAMKAMIEEVHFTPVHGSWKVYIIDEFHMLTKEAFNAFLKTLEEPPPHTVFILATTDLHKVNPTILSRCQRHDFRRIGMSDMVEALAQILRTENIPFEPQALEIIVRNSEGCMRDAESLLDRIVSYADGELKADEVASLLGTTSLQTVLQFFELLRQRDISGLLALLESLDASGIDIRNLTRQLLEGCRHVSLAIQGIYPHDCDESALAMLRQLADSDPRVLDMVYAILRECFIQLSNTPFPRYDLEFALIRAAHIVPGVAVDALLSLLQGEVVPPVEVASRGAMPEKKTLAPAVCESSVIAKPAPKAVPESVGLQQRLAEEVMQFDPPLGGMLRNVKLVAGASAGSFTLMVAEAQRSIFRTEKMYRLEQVLGQIVGGAVTIALQADQSEHRETLATHERRMEEDRNEELRQEIEAHPLAKELMRTLNGTLVSFKVLDVQNKT
ncbi:DNA polymerase III subunit gamma/tau [Chrysiogenes arsenatis]|uniref:DNA polymerase III subunit gamma/tau n=1 Tax=Chrysiogenes arsenatis TaxID=309797 RepID=UPI0004054538|nr:DNA polymerase III subunit gamma/tau [Chrysiogenes arsenatis]